MRWTPAALETRAHAGGRRSRVVLTPRRLVSSRRKMISAGDGSKRARSPGRARRKPLKPLRGECRVFFRCDRGDYARVVYFLSHARLRVHRAPGIPCALCMRVEGNFWQTSGASRGENARLCLDVIARSESDEAIHSCCSMDCFASLAMTISKALS